MPLLGAEGYRAAWNARARIARPQRPAPGPDGAPARPLRHARRPGARPVPGRPGAAGAGTGCRGLSGRRDRLRGDPRGRPAPGRRAGPPHPDLDRDLGPRGAHGPARGRLMAGALGWSTDQTDREVRHYLARVEAERASQGQADDETADAVRMGAPEIVPLA